MEVGIDLFEDGGNEGAVGGDIGCDDVNFVGFEVGNFVEGALDFIGDDLHFATGSEAGVNLEAVVAGGVLGCELGMAQVLDIALQAGEKGCGRGLIGEIEIGPMGGVLVEFAEKGKGANSLATERLDEWVTLGELEILGGELGGCDG